MCRSVQYWVPAMTVSMIAASSTELVKGPMQSREEPYAIKPYRDIRPYVGFRPTTPQKLAGCRILPPAVPSTMADCAAHT